MGFVKTPEEIASIEREFAAARWAGQWLSIQFLTDPATLARLLPPPLEPASAPTATATIGRWQSNCLGDFSGGVLSLAARHKDVEGAYVQAIYMDAEPPIVFGRELFGEPKKLASSGLVLDGERADAWVERHGTRLIDLSAEVGSDRGSGRGERSTFNFKSRTAAGGRGLEEDAILTRTRFESRLAVQRIGSGTVALGRTRHDPLAEIEVTEVTRAIYGEDETIARCRPVATVPADDFLPFHYGRQDDWLALSTAPVGVG